MTRVLVLALLLAAGCSGSAQSFDPAEFRSSPGWIVVNDVPMVLESADSRSGVAALAMILGYWGVNTWPPERIEAACPVIDQQGSRPRDLRACARQAGLEAHLVHGTWDDLVHELRLDRPVIVGLVKSYRKHPVLHYEVVVGLQPRERRLVTLDPAHGWRENGVREFQVEWESTTCLLLVFERPTAARWAPVVRDPAPGR